MNRKTGKILIGLGVPATAFGVYVLHFEASRIHFYVKDVIPGAAVATVGVILLSLGVGKVVKPIAGIGAFLLVGGIVGLIAYSGLSSQLGQEQYFADREALTKALFPVCEGKPMPNAAPRAERGPRKTLLIITPSSGNSYEWGADIDPSWRPQAIEDTQMVACFMTDKRAIDSCSYTDASGKTGVSIPAYQYTITAKVREAKTAKVLAEKVFEGGVPKTDCADSISLRKGDRPPAREGGMPSNADQLAFVRTFIE